MKRPKHREVRPVKLVKIGEDSPKYSEQVKLSNSNKSKRFPLSDYLIRGNLDYLAVIYQPGFSDMGRFDKFGELVGRAEFLSTLEYTLKNFKTILVRKENCITIPWFLGNYKFLKNHHYEGCTRPEIRDLERAIEKYEAKILEIETIVNKRRR